MPNQIEVDSSSGTVRISLSKKFYNKSAIDKTIRDFSGVCRAEMNAGKRFDITLKTGQDAGTLGLEFCNYLLALMKNEGMV